MISFSKAIKILNVNCDPDFLDTLLNNRKLQKKLSLTIGTINESKLVFMDILKEVIKK